MTSLTLSRSLPRTVLAGALATALLVAAAHITLPMWPVPMTMQPFAVLLIAGGLARSAAMGSVAAYLALAAAGLPVLAGSTGLGGPTTGYLLSYLLVAALLPGLRNRGAAGRLAALTGGMAMIYAGGLAWLTAFYTHSLATAFALGAAPFLLGDAVKVALAFACLSGLRRRTA